MVEELDTRSHDKVIVENFLDALSSSDFSALEEFIDDDTTWQIGAVNEPLKRGRGEIIGGFLKRVREEKFRAGDPKFVVRQLWWDDHWVFVRANGKGSLLEGGDYYNEYFFVFQVVGSRVRQVIEYMDTSVISF